MSEIYIISQRCYPGAGNKQSALFVPVNLKGTDGGCKLTLKALGERLFLWSARPRAQARVPLHQPPTPGSPRGSPPSPWTSRRRAWLVRPPRAGQGPAKQANPGGQSGLPSLGQHAEPRGKSRPWDRAEEASPGERPGRAGRHGADGSDRTARSKGRRLGPGRPREAAEPPARAHPASTRGGAARREGGGPTHGAAQGSGRVTSMAARPPRPPQPRSPLPAAPVPPGPGVRAGL